MAKEIFHTIRACNRTFDDKEWTEYCEMTRNDSTKRIFNTFGKYTFNDCDICVNPDIEELNLKGGAWGYYVSIKYAECGNGVWVFGLDYSTGTGGGGFGAAWSDTTKANSDLWHSGYASERECKIAAAEKAVKYLKNSYNLNDDNRGVLVNKLIAMCQEYKRALERPQVVQLELF